VCFYVLYVLEDLEQPYAVYGSCGSVDSDDDSQLSRSRFVRDYYNSKMSRLEASKLFLSGAAPGLAAILNPWNMHTPTAILAAYILM
jgi:hypothetical protein